MQRLLSYPLVGLSVLQFFDFFVQTEKDGFNAEISFSSSGNIVSRCSFRSVVKSWCVHISDRKSFRFWSVIKICVKLFRGCLNVALNYFLCFYILQ